MGQNESSFSSNLPHQKMNRNHFEFHYIIGKGGFGKVWKVTFKRTSKLYALKEMSKVKIIERKCEKNIKNERDFLTKLHHPFIVNMSYSFQDYENLYLAMDLLTGGDLRFHLCKCRTFTEEQTKLFIACVILGLEYIHSNNIIHRDIKPENLVCDESGYIRITDFGVAKIWHQDNANETSGTPGYMAPEVLCSQNHTYAVDFFALGVMGYEFMLGTRPYHGKSRKEIKHAILKKQAYIAYNEIPDKWSNEAGNFINHLLKRKDTKRLGYTNGISELKEHKWYAGFDWKGLYNKTKASPFIPSPNNNYDKKYCEEIDQLGSETIEKYQHIMKKENFLYCFKNYTYINENEIPMLTMNKFANQPTISSDQHKTMVTSNEVDTTKLKTNQVEQVTNSVSPPISSQQLFSSAYTKNIHFGKNILSNPINLVNTPANKPKFVIGSNLGNFPVRNCSNNVLLDLQRKKISLFENNAIKEQNNGFGLINNNYKKQFSGKLHLNLNGLPNYNKDYAVGAKKMEVSASSKLIPFQLPIINSKIRETSCQFGGVKGKKNKLSLPIPLTNRKGCCSNILRKSGSTGYVTNPFMKTRFTGEQTSNILSPKN